MEERRQRRATGRSVWLSPYLLAVALTPAFLQGAYDCNPGEKRLSLLEVEVSGVDQIVGFDPSVHYYSMTTSGDTLLVRAVTLDPAATATYQLRDATAVLEVGDLGTGGGEASIGVPAGESILAVQVRSPEGGFAFYNVNITRQSFPCTEQGILDAIAQGGGPHFFDCNGPTTVVTQAEIVIDSDVILDGEGNLTVEGTEPQGVFVVLPGTTSMLVGLGIVPLGELPNRAIRNEGSLTLTDCVVEAEGNYTAGMIYSEGSLALRGTVVRDVSGIGHCPGINSYGSLTLMDSTVSGITAPDGHAICSLGSVLAIRSAVVNNPNIGASILSDGDAILVDSTVSGNTITVLASSVAAEGMLTLINSTLVFSGGSDQWTISAGEYGGQADLYAANSVIVGPPSGSGTAGACFGFVTLSGGGNIESPGDTCGFDQPTDLVNVTAAELNLGPLADNGGPTLTHALLPGSVAIDHVVAAACVDENGDPLTTDQRGVSRPQGVACDAGAFEWTDCASVACEDENVCTSYVCNATTGLCQVTPVADGTPCSPGPACDLGDGLCSGGVCESTSGCGLCTPTAGLNVALPISGAPTSIYTDAANGFSISAPVGQVTFGAFGLGANANGSATGFEANDGLIIEFFDAMGVPSTASNISVGLSAAGIAGNVEVIVDDGAPSGPTAVAPGGTIDVPVSGAGKVEIRSPDLDPLRIYWEGLSFDHDCL